MKPKSILFAGLLAAFAMGAHAAADAGKPGEAAAAADATHAAQKKHSHVEEKTGMPQKVSESKSDKANAAKDKSRHLHPRDGK